MQEKNRATLTSYLSEHYRALLAYVRSQIDDTAARDGEDIVQDVALSILTRADNTAPIERLSVYIYRALRNRIIDELRKPGREALSLEACAAPGSDLTLADVLAGLRSDPAAAVEDDEARRRLYLALDALPVEQKAVIVATEVQGHSFAELAQAWAVPIGTLLARKSRGLKTLRARLALAGETQED